MGKFAALGSYSTGLPIVMARVAQIGIALGVLGIVLVLIGLFPGVTGISPTANIGIAQIIAMLAGMAGLILGALIYARFTFFENHVANLTQQIGTRLALTGLLFASLSGTADILGFGSHTLDSEVLLGSLQLVGVIGFFLMAAFGVLIYVVAGINDQ
ncbi:MAG TPA: hypothetical protein PKX07_20025 [Aggregatilineales bacterium]|nr:hypothetical protein [Aggregatilineales bacterium]